MSDQNEVDTVGQVLECEARRHAVEGIRDERIGEDCAIAGFDEDGRVAEIAPSQAGAVVAPGATRRVLGEES